MELRLTEQEQELLLELLNEQQKHLLHQINKASHHECKLILRERCRRLEDILQRLREPVSSVA